ncbi:NIL domain-containing protein [Pelatocladus sp. BLCC-F211]|uniref:NIL domain-containing protein n=1 Tax=Pelatocladus sp. BLCC-F211 TaxID=3342752 RepID=UPI0035B6D4B8
MRIFNYRQNLKKTKLSLFDKTSKHNTNTQIRLRLYIPQCYQNQPIISQLISKYGLVVNITGASLEKNAGKEGCFDVQLKGDISQISSGLSYLASLNLKIIGKPNADGDSWYC